MCRLVFPVDGLSEAEPLRIQLYDKDFNSKEFLGQVRGRRRHVHVLTTAL